MFRKNERGFTLLEALLVVVIIGILAAVIVPRFLYAKSEAEAKTCRGNLATLNTQSEKFFMEHNDTWPGAVPSDASYTTSGDPMTDLTVDIGDSAVLENEYFPDGAPTCPSGGTYVFDETGGGGTYENNRWFCVGEAGTPASGHGYVNWVNTYGQAAEPAAGTP